MHEFREMAVIKVLALLFCVQTISVFSKPSAAETNSTNTEKNISGEILKEQTKVPSTINVEILTENPATIHLEKSDELRIEGKQDLEKPKLKDYHVGDETQTKTTARTFNELTFRMNPIEMEQTRSLENNKKDIDSLKTTITLLKDELDRFNGLYINRLDQKLTSLATGVATLGSNVNNILSRAHVWDTFQLHVSAWNEQIKSLDRKVDIINSGQEKMILLEGRLSILLNLEYNSVRTMNKLTSLEDRMEELERTIRRQEQENIRQRDTLQEIIGSRGIVASLRGIEKKSDRVIAMMNQVAYARPFGRKRFINDSFPARKLLIKCAASPIVEELVKDIASKVDVIYDKVGSYNNSNEEEDKNVDNADDLEDIDQDYSVEMYQSDEPNEGKKSIEKIKNMQRRSEDYEDSGERDQRSNKRKSKGYDAELTKRYKRYSQDGYTIDEIEVEDVGNKIYVENKRREKEISKSNEKTDLIREKIATKRNVEESDRTFIEDSCKEVYKEVIYIKNQIRDTNKNIGKCMNLWSINEGESKEDNRERTEYKSANVIDAKIEQLKDGFKTICNNSVSKYKANITSDSKKYCWVIDANIHKDCFLESAHKCFANRSINEEILEELKEATVILIAENYSNDTYTRKDKETNEEKEELDVRQSDGKIIEDNDGEVKANVDMFKTDNYKRCVRDNVEENEQIDSVEDLSCYILRESWKKEPNYNKICNLPESRLFCDKKGFLIFQSRNPNSISFSKPWSEYKYGFGDLQSRSYWLGNEVLHILTRGPEPNVLRIELQDFDREQVWAEYDRFEISSESEKYRLRLSGYRGNATDSLSYHNGAKFSTIDTKNDDAPECCPCSDSYGGGGWWFKSCFESNLNGKNYVYSIHPSSGSISWETWHPEGSMYRTLMALSLPELQGNEYPLEDP